MTALAIYAGGTKFLPPVQEVMGGVLANFPEVTDVEEWSLTTDRTTPVLALGNVPPVAPVSMVKTLSQKQILSNPAALTELTAAMRLLTAPPTFKDVEIKIVTDILPPNIERSLGPVLVVDIETGGAIDMFLPAESWLLSLAIYDGGDTAYVWTESALKRPLIIAWILRLLRKKKLVAHNMKFDFQTLSAHFGEMIYGNLDTMLLHHAINPGAREHGLKALARKYLGAPDWDAGIGEFVKGSYKIVEGKITKGGIEGYVYPPALLAKYDARGYGLPIGYEAIPREILYPYNGWDVIWTWRLLEYLKPAVLGDPRLAGLSLMEYEFGNFFQDVEAAGFAVDIEYITSVGVRLKADREIVHANLRAHTGKENFNPNSPQQVKGQMLEYGYRMASTAEGKLEDVLKTDPPERVAQFIALLLEARGLTKIIGTYIDGILKKTHDGIVHPTFKVQGTNTGRTSCVQPNVQNIPRDDDGKDSLRRIFIPRDVETRSLIECDFSQAELRVMAVLSKDEYLISLFQPGMGDFFDALMPSAFPKLDLDNMPAAEKKNYRAKLKGVIYGLAYNRKAPAIAKELNMTVREAQAIINNFMRSAPSFYDWREWVQLMAVSEEETLVSPFGRYYQSELVTSRSKQNIINAGLAFLPQSTASDLCLQAALKIHPQLKQYDAFIVATIHDAIMVDGPDKNIVPIQKMMQYEMEESGRRMFGDVLPFAAEATSGKSWSGI